MIEVRDPSGRLVSSNTVIEEAIEDLVADAESHPEIETYRITYPSREVRVIPKVVVVPVPDEVLVQGSGIQFTQGQAGAFDLGAAIASAIPSGHVVTSITPNKALPSGVSADLANVEVDYDGVGAAASVGSAQDPLDLVVTTQADPALSDWVSRISASGVVAYHNFESDAEVNRFRWQGGLGNDLNGTGDGNCRRNATAGIGGGGCLEINIPAGGTSAAGWSRPFSALTGATNGRGVDDPGATKRAWNVTHGTDYLGTWKHDIVAHADNQAFTGWTFLGAEIYIQFRVHISANRALAGQPDGKLAFLGISGNGTSHFTPRQEIVIQSLRSKILRAYTNFSNGFNSALTEPQAASDSSGTVKQPGGAYAGTCIDNLSCSICWCYPMDEWVTVLVRLRPGHHGTSLGQTAAQDTLLEIKVARAGETSYTTIYSKANFVFNYEAGTPQGWNVFEPSGYMNNVAALSGFGWTQRFAQVIFSTQPIACPQV